VTKKLIGDFLHLKVIFLLKISFNCHASTKNEKYLSQIVHVDGITQRCQNNVLVMVNTITFLLLTCLIKMPSLLLTVGLKIDKFAMTIKSSFRCEGKKNHCAITEVK
jgi:hypothetical protein